MLPYYVLAFSVYLFACSKDRERACDVSSPWVKPHIALRVCENIGIYLIADFSWEDGQERERHVVDILADFWKGPPLFCRGEPIFGVVNHFTRESASRQSRLPNLLEGFEEKSQERPVDCHLPTQFQELIIVSPTFSFFDHASSN